MKTLTDASFDAEIRQAAVPVLIDFWAAWCGPCISMAPIVEELADELAGKVMVGKLNVDENQQTPGRFNIMSIPTFLLFKNGQVVEQMVGSMSKDAIKEKILKHLI